MMEYIILVTVRRGNFRRPNFGSKPENVYFSRSGYTYCLIQLMLLRIRAEILVLNC